MAVSVNRKNQYDEGSLDQYLRDISIYPLITREEEVTLAQRIRKNDQEALDKLVRSNLRFVVSVAKKYQNQGVSLSDSMERARAVQRNADNSRLLGERLKDALADPPHRVRDELDSLRLVELVGCADQSEVALVDQVGE